MMHVRKMLYKFISPVVMLILMPIAVKMPLLLGLLVSDPLAKYGEMDRSWKHGLTAGLQTIDPNIAVTSHALGTYAAQELLSGRIPWWNPYEGVGVPLIAEMQSAALFPLTAILLLPKGQLLFHISLQILSGLFTYGFLRSLKLTKTSSLFGASIFEFNAVFAWLANAVVNPIPFLPLLLWGVELSFAEKQSAKIKAAFMIATGVSLSLYAGFPEVAYLNGLFVALWTVCKVFPNVFNYKFELTRITLAVITGILLSAPLLIPFFDYLSYADVGVHDGAKYYFINTSYIITNIFPYWSGGIWTPPFGNDFWGKTGGYTGFLLPVLSISGLFVAARRRQSVALAVWIMTTLSLSYGASWLFEIFKHLPGIKEAAIYRYFPASWIMALCILASFAIDHALKHYSMKNIKFSLLIVTMLCMATIYTFAGYVGWYPRNLFGWLATSFQLTIVLFFTLLIFRPTILHKRYYAINAMAGLTVLESIFLFAVPVMAHRREIKVDHGSVVFMQHTLGLQRFATLGPIAPNYGTYFKIAQLNHNDLPVPKMWNDFVRHKVDRAADAIIFIKISSKAELLRNLDGLASAGVKYVVSSRKEPISQLQEVFRDTVSVVYKIDNTKPYFSSPSCDIVAHDRVKVDLLCKSKSYIERLELAMPGWHSVVNGSEKRISAIDEIFQMVEVSSGHNVVEFRYEPPHLFASKLLFAVGLLLMAINGILLFKERKLEFARAGVTCSSKTLQV